MPSCEYYSCSCLGRSLFICLSVLLIVATLPVRFPPYLRNRVLSSSIAGTQLGTTCKHAVVTCPGGSNQFPVTCPLSCPQHYAISGARSITCQTSGQWTSYATSFCRRINDPPTQVSIEGNDNDIGPKVRVKNSRCPLEICEGIGLP